MNKLKYVIDNQLCLGCGLCEAICGSCKMELDETTGYYKPSFSEITQEELLCISRSCPSINVENEKHLSSKVWGDLLNLYEASSVNKEIRKAASSGGVVTEVCSYLLETHIVDAILHVGLVEGSCLYNELKVSKTPCDVLKNAASRYAPALTLNKIINILDNSDAIYAFVGKPCDIVGVKNLIKVYPKYKNRIVFFISIFCAGMPSYNGTLELLKKSFNKSKPIKIVYRGDGWPGFFKVDYSSGEAFKVSYNESWGNVLNRYLPFRCKICPDGIGLFADISVGDAWHTLDGYPDFSEREGQSFVMIRTLLGQKIFNLMLESDRLVYRFLDMNEISKMQYYQYQRRLLVGYRLIPVQILSGFLFNFKRLGITNMFLKAKITTGIINLCGTMKRFINIVFINRIIK